MARDAKLGFQQTWLKNLTQPDLEVDTKVELEKLDTHLGAIAHVSGFEKLGPGIRSKDLEQFFSTMLEVKTITWIGQFNLLREIQPDLPKGKSKCDFRIEVDGRPIYGEIWGPKRRATNRIDMGKIVVESVDQEFEQPRLERKLQGKGNSQLPPEIEGVWVVHVRGTPKGHGEAVRRDMASRRNLLGAVLWIVPGHSGRSMGGIPLRALDGDNHGIHWIGNEAAADKALHGQLLSYLRTQ